MEASWEWADISRRRIRELYYRKGEYELLLKANSEYSSVFDNNKGIVILNTELNDELILEGLARDVEAHSRNQKTSWFSYIR